MKKSIFLVVIALGLTLVMPSRTRINPPSGDVNQDRPNAVKDEPSRLGDRYAVPHRPKIDRTSPLVGVIKKGAVIG